MQKGLRVSPSSLMSLFKSSLSGATRDGFSSCEMSVRVVIPAISSRDQIIAPLKNLVTVHLFLAETFCVKAVIPVCLEAASLFIVCSNVMSTELLEKAGLLRRTESAPPLKLDLIPG